MCVSKSRDFPELINATSKVMVLMPAKAAGQAFGAFVHRCRAATIQSHHVHSKNKLNDFRNASKDTLFIWNHRDETSRFVSAIRHAVKRLCQGGRSNKIKFELLER